MAFPTHEQIGTYLEATGWVRDAEPEETIPWITYSGPGGNRVRLLARPDYGDYELHNRKALQVVAHLERRPSPEDQVAAAVADLGALEGVEEVDAAAEKGDWANVMALAERMVNRSPTDRAKLWGAVVYGMAACMLKYALTGDSSPVETVTGRVPFPDLRKRAARRAKRIADDPKRQQSLVDPETLQEAQDSFRQRLFEGKTPKCPCCGRKGKVYKRKLNSGMARMLIRFYEVHFRLPCQEWVHVHDLFGGFGQKHRDWPVLRLWGLLERKDKRTDKENASGFWKLTAKGRAFVRGEGEVPKHVFMYNRQKVDESDERITIRQALGDAFDYAELMTVFNAGVPR